MGYGSDSETIKRSVVEAIKDFSDTNLGTFDVSFRYSKLLYAIDQADKSILSNDTQVSYAATTSLPDKLSLQHGYERSASNKHKGGEYKYSSLNSFSYDVQVAKGSIFSDWFYVHVDALDPSMSFSYQSAYRTDRDTEWSWNKDMRYYNWDDLEFPTPLGMSEHVKLIKVRFIDDKRRSTVFRERHPSESWQGKGVTIDKRDGRGYLHLLTDGGHLVPFKLFSKCLTLIQS